MFNRRQPDNRQRRSMTSMLRKKPIAQAFHSDPPMPPEADRIIYIYFHTKILAQTSLFPNQLMHGVCFDY
jgi:hypothetical protein